MNAPNIIKFNQTTLDNLVNHSEYIPSVGRWYNMTWINQTTRDSIEQLLIGLGAACRQNNTSNVYTLEIPSYRLVITLRNAATNAIMVWIETVTPCLVN